MMKLLLTIFIALMILAYVLYIVIKTIKQIKNNENPCASCPSLTTCQNKTCDKVEDITDKKS